MHDKYIAYSMRAFLEAVKIPSKVWFVVKRQLVR